MGALAVVALLGGPPPAARAQARGERAARAHFQRAEKAFNLGKFDDALRAYEAAYEAKALPAFLFNIAQCHRNLGNAERAVFFYERFLALEPAAPNRATVEELIAEQRRKLEPPKPAEPAPAPSPPAPSAPPAERVEPGAPAPPPPASFAAPPPGDRGEDAAARPVYTRWWFWGAAAAVAGGAVAAILLARRDPAPAGTAIGPPIDYRGM
jgi:tetratricopeptide (TPR) repeat protein